MCVIVTTAIRGSSWRPSPQDCHSAEAKLSVARGLICQTAMTAARRCLSTWLTCVLCAPAAPNGVEGDSKRAFDPWLKAQTKQFSRTREVMVVNEFTQLQHRHGKRARNGYEGLSGWQKVSLPTESPHVHTGIHVRI